MFVDLVIILVGEIDIEIVRIICLYISCLGFVLFIFDLKCFFGFDDLMKICELVWVVVDVDFIFFIKLVWLVIM